MNSILPIKPFPTAVALATALLLCPTPAARAQQGSGACPDVRASPIPARVDRSNDVERCGFGIKIFGIGGGIFGPKCPDKKFIYPAHQNCKGEASVGTLCRPGGFLEVEVEDCDCVEATVFGTGLLVPECACVSGGFGGHVQDAKTEECPTN